MLLSMWLLPPLQVVMAFKGYLKEMAVNLVAMEQAQQQQAQQQPLGYAQGNGQQQLQQQPQPQGPEAAILATLEECLTFIVNICMYRVSIIKTLYVHNLDTLQRSSEEAWLACSTVPPSQSCCGGCCGCCCCGCGCGCS
jgi:hypothetical protein